MGTVVLDASVLLGLFDPLDALHEAAVDAVRASRVAGDRQVVPASVLAEVLVGAARTGDDAVIARRASVRGAFGECAPLDEAVAVAAARHRARHRWLRLPDALVVATADVLGADRVLTGDKRWQELDGVVVIGGG